MLYVTVLYADHDPSSAPHGAVYWAGILLLGVIAAGVAYALTTDAGRR